MSLSREDREMRRQELTRLLTDAHSHLKLAPEPSFWVKDFIENYEFQLAYELMIDEIQENDLPAGDAIASLRAAAVMMGLDKPE
jgi:hypothetical protein